MSWTSFNFCFSLSLGRPSSRNNNGGSNSSNNNNNNTIDGLNLSSIVGTSQQQQQQRLYNNTSNNNSDSTFLSNNFAHVASPLSTPELSPFDVSFGGGATSSNASVSLPSPMAYDGFDDPLSGSRHSFRGSLSDVDGFSVAETSPNVARHTFSEIQR